MIQNKLKSYLGFSIKSGDVVYGFDNLLETKKKVKCVIYDELVNVKIEQKLKLLCEYKNWALVKLENQTISQLVGRENCKVLGLINVNLIKPILNENVKIIFKGEF